MMFDAPAMLQPLLDTVGRPFARPYEVAHYRPAPDWMLDVSKDRFTGATTCTLRSHSLTYQGGVVTVHFGHSVDTANALFRLDDGPARSVGDVAVEAAGKGASFLTRNTSNPSNGDVWLPATQLESHKTVSIRPNAHAAVRIVSLAGLPASLSAAGMRGCPTPGAAVSPAR